MPETMRIMLLLVVLAAASGSGGAEPQTEAERFAPVADLAGRCWVGHFPESTLRDVHCWEWAVAKRFLRDRHRVMGSEGTSYQGETLYGWDSEDEVLRYWYFNSLGGVSEGSVERTEDGWRFREHYRGSPGEMDLLSSYSRQGEDGYAIETRRLREGSWEPFGSIRFEALGEPAVESQGPWAESWDLVFNTDRDDNYEIYRRDLHRGKETNLSSAATTEWVYSVGDRLITASNRQAGSEPGYRLYRLDPAGGELEPLTDFPVADSWVGSLPGGKGFVVCAPEAGDTELFRLDGEGKIVKQLTDNDVDDCQPDVTPDGKTIVFWSTRSGSAEIWAMGIDGGSPRLLTRFPGNDQASDHRYGGEGPPRISPDGSRIAWISIRDGEDWDLYSMRLDGTDVRRLTDHLADDAYPAWSPDGKFIAFDSNRHGSIDIFVIPADGGKPQRLTDHPGNEQAPSWLPRVR